MEDNRWYDEEHELPAFWGWLFVITFSAAIMGFGWLVYLLIPDAPRLWDFGQLPDTPAESIYSTEEPGISKRPHRQVGRLPEAQPQTPGAAGKH
jgi:hypothetical protein